MKAIEIYIPLLSCSPVTSLFRAMSPTCTLEFGFLYMTGFLYFVIKLDFQCLEADLTQNRSHECQSTSEDFMKFELKAFVLLLMFYKLAQIQIIKTLTVNRYKYSLPHYTVILIIALLVKHVLIAHKYFRHSIYRRGWLDFFPFQNMPIRLDKVHMEQNCSHCLQTNLIKLRTTKKLVLFQKYRLLPFHCFFNQLFLGLFCLHANNNVQFLTIDCETC